MILTLDWLPFINSNTMRFDKTNRFFGYEKHWLKSFLEFKNVHIFLSREKWNVLNSFYLYVKKIVILVFSYSYFLVLLGHMNRTIRCPVSWINYRISTVTHSFWNGKPKMTWSFRIILHSINVSQEKHNGFHNFSAKMNANNW